LARRYNVQIVIHTVRACLCFSVILYTVQLMSQTISVKFLSASQFHPIVSWSLLSLFTICLWHPLYSSNVFADLQLVSEYGHCHIQAFPYRTLAVPRTRTILHNKGFALACGTIYWLLYDRLPDMDSLGNVWKNVYLRPRNRSALRLSLIVCCTNTLIYLLTCSLFWVSSLALVLPQNEISKRAFLVSCCSHLESASNVVWETFGNCFCDSSPINMAKLHFYSSNFLWSLWSGFSCFSCDVIKSVAFKCCTWPEKWKK